MKAPIKELETGSTFSGRYQVIEELGKGGMGRVYKVLDTDIKEKVALKLLKPEIATDRETIERFSNELRLARKISHRNVCRMYDLGKAEGAHFITMEYVHGEDLKSMLQMMGQLSPGQIVSIGKQVCDGLAEAHSLGVVHRDLKPQNIMIDKAGNAKIMDFGIARSVREKGITGPSVLIGTPEYMSPEQAEAKEIDQRSDIYSLGIILYEMATGRVPFEGETALSIAMRHKGEIPKNPKEFNPHIPDDLSSLILKCLEKDKARRYQTAAELRSGLEKMEKGIPTTELVVPKPKSITSKEITVKFTLKRQLVPVLAGIAVVIGAFVLWRVVLKKPITLLPEQKRSIAVISFENQTGDKAYDYLSKVIPNLLITNLEQSGYFNATTWERLYDLLKQVGKPDAEFIGRDLGFELCQKDSVEVIVLGSVTKAGNTFVTDAKVFDVETKKLLGTANSRGENPDSILKNQVNDLCRQIAKGVGLSERQFAAATKNIGGLTTHSLEAYNYYLKGEEDRERNRPELGRAYFEKAVEIDPNFAMALRRLGGESLKKAMELSKNVSEKERLYIEAAYANQIERNRSKAKSILDQLLSKYPKEKVALVIRAQVSDNTEEGIEFCRKATELAPDFGTGWMGMGYSFLMLKDYANALDTFKKYISYRPRDANAIDSLAEAYFHVGQIDNALEYYHRVLQMEPDFYPSIPNLGYIYALKENYAQALEWIDKYISLSTGNYRQHAYFMKGFLFAWLGNGEKSLGYVQMAEDAAKASGFEPGNGYADWLRAWIYYDRGDFEASRKYNARSLPRLAGMELRWGSFDTIGSYFLNGLIDIEENKLQSAKSQLAEMIRLFSGIASNIPSGWFIHWARDRASFETEWLRAMIYLKENALEKADSSVQEAASFEFPYMANHVENPIFRYNAPFQRDALARAYAEHGEIDRSIGEYDRLITFDPAKPSRALIHPLYHYRLGKLYDQKGLKDKARAQYERFLALWKDADPGRAEVEDAKRRILELTK